MLPNYLGMVNQRRVGFICTRNAKDAHEDPIMGEGQESRSLLRPIMDSALEASIRRSRPRRPHIREALALAVGGCVANYELH